MMNLFKDADLEPEDQVAAREYIEYNIDDIIDERGRHRRWVFEQDIIENVKIPSCCGKYGKKDEHESDLHFVQQFHRME